MVTTETVAEPAVMAAEAAMVTMAASAAITAGSATVSVVTIRSACAPKPGASAGPEGPGLAR
jgi:hypothetical protein